MKRLIVALVALAAVGLGSFVLFRSKPPQGIIVILLDTLRADHLGFYGYSRDTSPTLDRFASENLAFSYAMTAAPWTPPSVATLFTGLYPTSHGWMPPNDREKVRENNWVLAPDLVTLAEIFKENGYRTAAASPNPWISEEFGYNQGFDSFWYKARVRAKEINNAAYEFLKSFKAGDKPYFLYLHYLDPHDPYTPPPPYDTKYSGAAPGGEYNEKMTKHINSYDGEIRYLDDSLGELFSYLKRQGLYDSSAIVIVADHGEQFMEHGNVGHGYQLHNEELHVPLMIKLPGGAEQRKVESVVSTVDVYPTILEIANILPPKAVPGISLLDSEALAAREGVFSEIHRKFQQRSFTTVDGMKLITGSREEGKDYLEGEDLPVMGLYNIRTDYREFTPIDDPSRIANLRSSLGETHQLAVDSRVAPNTMRGQLKDTTVEHLKSLGYLQ